MSWLEIPLTASGIPYPNRLFGQEFDFLGRGDSPAKPRTLNSPTGTPASSVSSFTLIVHSHHVLSAQCSTAPCRRSGDTVRCPLLISRTGAMAPNSTSNGVRVRPTMSSWSGTTLTVQPALKAGYSRVSAAAMWMAKPCESSDLSLLETPSAPWGPADAASSGRRH